jgi:hypothetical protein
MIFVNSHELSLSSFLFGTWKRIPPQNLHKIVGWDVGFQTWSLTWCKIIIWSWEGLLEGWAGLPVICLCCSCLLCMTHWWPNFNIVIVMKPTKDSIPSEFSCIIFQGWHWSPLTEKMALLILIVIQICTTVLWTPFSGHKLNEARLRYG